MLIQNNIARMIGGEREGERDIEREGERDIEREGERERENASMSRFRFAGHRWRYENPSVRKVKQQALWRSNTSSCIVS